MNFEPENLPSDPASLHKIILSMQSEILRLEEMVYLFKKQFFGPKSEVRQVQDQNQIPIFGVGEDPEPIVEQEKVIVPAHARKKTGRKPLPEDLPRVDILHDLPESEKVCDCGASLSRIGEEVCEKLDYVPARLQVERHIRPKYACKSCEGVESSGPTVKIAPPAKQLIPKSLATEDLLAHIVTAKFADSLPLYRQQKIFARHGVDLPRATLCNWLMEVANRCTPVMELLKERIRSGPLVNVDESPLQVLKEPGRKNTTKSYMWVFCGGPPGRPAILYQYSPTRSGQVATAMLGDYKGFVQSDAFSGYEQLKTKPGIVRLGCMVHVRRKFMDVVKVRKAARGGKPLARGLADEALDFIGELYKIEKLARIDKLDFDQIRQLRQEKSEPLLKRFETWLKAHESSVPPKSLLGQAIKYALSNWQYLTVYLKEGYLKPDNNVAENTIRPFVLGRKNWLFAGSPRGADASATFFSLIETAKANGLEPYAYLKDLFAKLPLANTRNDYLALLPG